MNAYSLPDDLRHEILAAENFPGSAIPEYQLKHIERLRQKFIEIHGDDGFPDAESFTTGGVPDSAPIQPCELSLA